MSLKAKFYLLTFLLHSVLLVSAYFVVEDNKFVFLLIEATLILSLILFLALLKRVLAPFEYVDLFSDILSEQEYASRFSHTGNHELDNLMLLFNQMLSQLYDERVKIGEQKGMLEQLMAAIPLGIIVFDYDQKISHLNPAAERLFSVSSEKMQGKVLTNIGNSLADSLHNLKAAQSQLLSDNQGRRYRCHRNHFRDRGFDRQFIVIQELTNELQLSERTTYEKLIRIMSHEVNNTIAATGSLLRSCLNYSEQIDDRERKDYVDAMTLVIERTDNLNRFMKEYAQLVRPPKPSLESCNLNQLIISITALFNTSLAERKISIHLPSSSIEQTIVQADQKQIEQVLINIIKNAIDSIESDGDIYITLQTLGGKSILRISDSGNGISSESLGSIFTPFYTTKKDGQGIGLMLIREILEAHKFEFSLRNEEPNGACFEIVFDESS